MNNKIYRASEPIVYNEETLSGLVDLQLWEYIEIGENLRIRTFFSSLKTIDSINGIEYFYSTGNAEKTDNGILQAELRTTDSNEIIAIEIYYLNKSHIKLKRHYNNNSDTEDMFEVVN